MYAWTSNRFNRARDSPVKCDSDSIADERICARGSVDNFAAGGPPDHAVSVRSRTGNHVHHVGNRVLLECMNTSDFSDGPRDAVESFSSSQNGSRKLATTLITGPIAIRRAAARC